MTDIVHLVVDTWNPNEFADFEYEQGYLFEDEDVKEMWDLGEELRYIDIESTALDLTPSQREKFTKNPAEHLSAIKGREVYLDVLEPTSEDRLVLDTETNEIFYLSDFDWPINLVAVYYNGHDWETAIVDIVKTFDLDLLPGVSLNYWNGSNWVFGRPGNTANLYKLDDDEYLVEYISNWAGERNTGAVLTEDEVREMLEQHKYDEEEINEKLRSINGPDGQ